MEEDNVAVLANQVGGEGGKDDARHGSQDCLEGFLVIPEAGGGENLGHVNQEDHEPLTTKPIQTSLVAVLRP